MPGLTVWMLRSSLVWLSVAVITGSILYLEKGFSLNPNVWRLLPMHVNAAMTGWMVQFVFGVAYWIYPRYLHGPARGRAGTGWVLMILLNGSVVAVLFPAGGAAEAVAGPVLFLSSVLVFIWIIWRRVVSYRSLS